MIIAFKRTKKTRITECIGFYKYQSEIQKDCELLYGEMLKRNVKDGHQIYEYEKVFIIFKLETIKQMKRF